MVTLKNIDSPTHESWRYPTKHVFPESVSWKFAPGLSQMHTFMVAGNCLVELNLTSKRSSGWVGGFYYLHRSRCVVIVLWDAPAGSAGDTSRDDASWPEPTAHLDAKILVLPKNPGSILQRAGGQGAVAPRPPSFGKSSEVISFHPRMVDGHTQEYR